MSVAIPTAIPVVPFNKILGIFAGNKVGSNKEPSKLGCQSTVPSFNSDRSKSANPVSFDSV